jgi:hypothetical protein
VAMHEDHVARMLVGLAAPVVVENCEPCPQGRVQIIAVLVAWLTSQPACVQIAEKAEKFPLVG